MAVRIGWRRNLNTNEVGLEERRDMKTRFVGSAQLLITILGIPVIPLVYKTSVYLIKRY